MVPAPSLDALLPSSLVHLSAVGIVGRHARLVRIVFLQGRVMAGFDRFDLAMHLAEAAWTRGSSPRVTGYSPRSARSPSRSAPSAGRRRRCVGIKPEGVAHFVERDGAEFRGGLRARPPGLRIGFVFVEPGEFQIGQSKFFGDDLVDEVLDPLFGRLEALVLGLGGLICPPSRGSSA